MNHHFSLSATLAALLLICLPGLLQSQNALNFDGTNDFVQTTYSGVLGSANRTFEAWINVAAGATSNNAILDYGLNAVGSRNTFLINPNNQVAFISGGTNANISSSINAIIPGQWTHVAFVLNSGTGFFYVNGVQVGTGSLTSVNTPGGNANLRIGQRVSGGSIPFEGEIDEVRIWNYARTVTEIMNDMNAEFCAPQTGLMAYYQFNEGVAGGTNTGVTTAPDFSGNGNNGTLTNFSLSGGSSNWVSGVTISAGSIPVVLNETACSDFTSPSGNFIWTASGTYLDTVLTPGGCDSTFTVNLILDPVDADFSTTSPMSLCPGTTVSFQDASTGGTAYTWTANMTPFSQTNLATYTFADTGIVEIMLVVGNATCSDTSSMTFAVSGPFISNSVVTEESCTVGMDGAIDIDIVGGTAPFQYLWSTGAITQDLSQLFGGNYSVIITDAQGCMAMDTFTVENVLNISAGFSTTSDPSLCPGETVIFTNTSQMATAYDWQIDGQSFAQSTDLTYTFPASGQVLIELIASEGNCEDSTSLLFTVNASPQVVTTVAGESCPGSQDGAIDLELTGGSAPFSFVWSNAAVTEDLAALSVGNYAVTITDSANCSISDTFEIETLGGVQAAFANFSGAQGMKFVDESLSDSTITSWYWEFGTGVAADTSNEQSPVFEYFISGTYEVCLKVEDLFGCTDSVCKLISFSVGIDPALYEAIELYPNPNNGQFYLDLSEIAGEEVQLVMFDVLGKQVHASEFRAETQYDMELSELATGLYYLQVMTEKGHYRTKVIIE